MIVAIDGPAGAGKSTVARAVAKELGLSFLDTGAMYRALALVALEEGIDLADGAALADRLTTLDLHFEGNPDEPRLYIGDRDASTAIRTPAVSAGASAVARHAQVRAEMVARQQQLGRRQGGLVAEGRDMGTVVFPHTPYKIFLVASLEERARRRLRDEQQRAPAEAVTLAQVRLALKERDQADSERAVAPLRQAEDATRVDTTGLTIEQVIAEVVRLVRQRAQG